MKSSYAAVVALALLFGCACCVDPALATPNKPPGEPAALGAPLDSVVNEVQKGLQKAQDTLAKSDLPPLQNVQLTLHTQVDKDATGKVKLLFISFGGGQGAKASQELVLTLVPPKPRSGPNLAFTQSPSAADSIVGLIQAAAQAVRTAEKGDPPFEAKGLTLELAFTVTEAIGGGLQFNVGVVSADVGGDVKNSSEQRIKITFGR